MKMNRINCLQRIIDYSTFFVGGRDFDNYKEDAAQINTSRTNETEANKVNNKIQNNSKIKNAARETKIDLVMVNAVDNILDWLIRENI